jgi:hypothetical protein
LAKDQCLYLTKPSSLYKLDLKTAVLSLVLSQNIKIPNPNALYANSQKLYVADFTLPEIYEVEATGTTNPAQAPVQLNLAGKGTRIKALTESDGILYALQAGNTPLARVSPEYSPVGLASPGVFTLDNNNSDYVPLFQFTDGEKTSFVSSPNEPRKFYICNQKLPSILSVKDYKFDAYVGARSGLPNLTDFNYPKLKPKNTFRILIYGDSRIVSGPAELYSTLTNYTNANFPDGGFRVYTFPKLLERMLNVQASLCGWDKHFEVLVWGQPGWHVPIAANEDIPKLVNKYDVDLAVVC